MANAKCKYTEQEKIFFFLFFFNDFSPTITQSFIT